MRHACGFARPFDPRRSPLRMMCPRLCVVSSPTGRGSCMPRFLTALPVFNEVGHVRAVLDEVRRYSPEILVVDDGSTDGTSELLDQMDGLHLVRHEKNRGYGAALRSAFEFARAND